MMIPTDKQITLKIANWTSWHLPETYMFVESARHDHHSRIRTPREKRDELTNKDEVRELMRREVRLHTVGRQLKWWEVGEELREKERERKREGEREVISERLVSLVSCKVQILGKTS